MPTAGAAFNGLINAAAESVCLLFPQRGGSSGYRSDYRVRSKVMKKFGAHSIGSSRARLASWTNEVARYISETRSVSEFAKLMQIRLSLSKVGALVCPKRVRWTVDLASLGRVCLRSHTSDISVLNELVVWNGYTMQASHVGVPRTILDLGANTGLAARWFMHKWPQARIVCVEPEPSNVDVLRANLSSTPNSAVLPVAAGATSRKAMLHTANLEFGYTIVGDTAGPSVEVHVATMLEILAAGQMSKVDLLKVDIEGSEREVFSDCAEWISLVDFMIVECHGDYGPSELLDDCRRNGCEFTPLHIEEKPDWGFSVVTATRSGRVN